MPVQIKLTFRGADAIVSGLQRLKLAVGNMPAEVIRPELEQARDEVRTYPPELPGQTYVRTGARYDRTRVEAYQGNNQYAKSYVLKSDPTYAGQSADPYVVGDAQGRGQAGIHQGRWTKLYDAVQRALSRVRVQAQRFFKDATGLWGGGL